MRSTIKSRASAAALCRINQVAASVPQLTVYCSNKTAAQIVMAESLACAAMRVLPVPIFAAPWQLNKKSWGLSAGTADMPSPCPSASQNSLKPPATTTYLELARTIRSHCPPQTTTTHLPSASHNNLKPPPSTSTHLPSASHNNQKPPRSHDPPLLTCQALARTTPTATAHHNPEALSASPKAPYPTPSPPIPQAQANMPATAPAAAPSAPCQ